MTDWLVQANPEPIYPDHAATSSIEMTNSNAIT